SHGRLCRRLSPCRVFNAAALPVLFTLSLHDALPIFDELLEMDFDKVVTVCDAAAESRPIFPRPVPKLHRGFQDPPALAARATSEEDALKHYRRVRDEIRDFVSTLPDQLKA